MERRKSKLELKNESSPDELVISSEDHDPWEDGTVLASNAKGSSLTLLEEYARRQKESHTKTFFFGLICAAVSLTFAYLNFQNL